MAIRVLIIEHGRGFGGSINSLIRLLQPMDRTHVQPILLLDSPTPSTELVRSLGIQIITLEKPLDWIFREATVIPPFSYLVLGAEWVTSVLPQIVQLYSVIRRERIDILHLNNHLDQVGGMIAARLAGIPVVCHLRNVRRLRRFERFAARFVDRFLMLSEASCEVYASQGLPVERLRVVYDPIQDVRGVDGRLPMRQALGISAGAPVIGILSRIVPGKGHDDFLRAAAQVRMRHPQAKFVIAGRSNDSTTNVLPEWLAKIVKELGVQEQVVFAGWQPDVRALIASLDVIVDASVIREGTRLSILESMAMGKPVVATDVGGEKEFFDEGRRGIFVQAGRPEQLGQAIARLLDDRAAAARMGQAAQVRVLELCDAKRSAARLTSVYEEVAARRVLV